MIVRLVTGLVLLATMTACGSSQSGGSGNTAGSNTGIQLISGPVQPTTTSPTATPGGTGGGSTTGTIVLGQQTAASTVSLTAKSSVLGTIVTDAAGFTLYRFDKDSPNPSKTVCTGSCAITWPPVVVTDTARVYVTGVATSKVGTVTRPDGTKQLTIGGWPIYRFAGDHAAGQTNGQGIKGIWFAIAPTGAKASTAVAGSSGGSSNVVLTTEQTPTGSVVVATGRGRTVYVNSTDSTNPSQVLCSGTCSAGFVPVAAQAGTVRITGVAASEIGTVTGADGVLQLTLDGFPLYTNSADANPGDTNGSTHAGWFTLTLQSGGQ
jgi:predicted lipoprotein with Yx(FWY)xxD motif